MAFQNHGASGWLTFPIASRGMGSAGCIEARILLLCLMSYESDLL